MSCCFAFFCFVAIEVLHHFLSLSFGWRQSGARTLQELLFGFTVLQNLMICSQPCLLACMPYASISRLLALLDDSVTIFYRIYFFLLSSILCAQAYIIPHPLSQFFSFSYCFISKTLLTCYTHHKPSCNIISTKKLLKPSQPLTNL